MSGRYEIEPRVRPASVSPRLLASLRQEWISMLKENNCCCVVCQVERSLLNSLSTQTARTHFRALVQNYPILNHFDSPADVIAQLHEHERVELVNHKAWNGILHALVDSIAGGTAEEIGQQLLLVAYAPAIHKVYREVCQKFPGLCPEDIAQQGSRIHSHTPIVTTNRLAVTVDFEPERTCA